MAKVKIENSAWRQKTAKAKALWDKKKGKPGGGANYGPAEIDDGQYIAKLTSARLGITKRGKGAPYFATTMVVTEGSFEGTQLSTINMWDATKPDRLEADIQRLVDRLEGLGIDTNNVDVTDLSDMTEVVNYLNDPENGQPLVNVTVSSGVGEQTGKPWQNIYANGVVHSDDESPRRAKAPKKTAKKTAKKR